jgi:16S rRNA (uracil1498-N3)-methyltransferase
MKYFYSPNPNIETSQFDLDSEESRHIVKVLRKREGELLYITNGKGILFETELLSANPKKCTLQVLSSTQMAKPKVEIHLAVAPTKRVERFQWFLEKATEIGVTRIIPILCDRSERETLPMERLNRVIQEAMKQSLQTWLPELSAPEKLSDFLKTSLPKQRFIAHCELAEKGLLPDLAETGVDSVVLIGPEGDFTSAEIETALSQNFKPISLGVNRLRTETAALLACTALNLLNHS